MLRIGLVVDRPILDEAHDIVGPRRLGDKAMAGPRSFTISTLVLWPFLLMDKEDVDDGSGTTAVPLASVFGTGLIRAA